MYLHPSSKPQHRERRSSKAQKSFPPFARHPQKSQAQSDNPFFSPEPDDDDDFTPSSKPIYTASHTYGSREAAHTISFSDLPRSSPTRTWQTFCVGAGKTSAPWNTRGRGTTGEAGPTSLKGKTSSRTAGLEEDPFH